MHTDPSTDALKQVASAAVGRLAELATDLTIERVPAHDLRVGDVVIVDGLIDDYVGRIRQIEEYAVHRTTPPLRPDMEANTRCLCIRLPHLNTYRALHDTVRRVRDNNVSTEHV